MVCLIKPLITFYLEVLLNHTQTFISWLRQNSARDHYYRKFVNWYSVKNRRSRWQS